MADDNKNPLDVLEELLADKSAGGGASGGKGKGGSPAEVAAAAAKTKRDKAEKLEAELEQKRQEFEQKQKEQAIVDEQKLVKQREAIETIKGSDAYRAREAQDVEKKDQTDKKIVAADGFEINQLDHKKV